MRAAHSAGPVWWTLVPWLPTATVADAATSTSRIATNVELVPGSMPRHRRAKNMCRFDELNRYRYHPGKERYGKGGEAHR
jgi:hypothetical protein